MSGLKSHNFISAEERRRREIERKKREHEEMLKRWQEEEKKFLTNQKRVEQKIDNKYLTEQSKRTISKIKEDKYIVSTTKSNKKEKKVATKEDIQKNIIERLEELKTYNSQAYKEKLKFYNNIKNGSLGRLEFFLTSLKLDTYEYKQKYIKTKSYKMSIKELIKDSDIKADRVEQFLNKEIIDEYEYQEMFNYIQEQITKKSQQDDIKKITQALKDLNYFVIDDSKEIEEKLQNREKIMLSIGSSDYKVVVVFNNNKLITRFVRVTDSLEDTISSSQKLEDGEKLKQWCQVQQKLHNRFKEMGLVNNLEVLEDENSEVIHIVERKTSKTKSKQREEIYGQSK